MTDERDALPLTDAKAFALLADSRALLARIEASGQGIYEQPADEERPLVEGVMRVCDEWGGDESEQRALRLLCQQAGLSLRAWGLIRRMNEQYTPKMNEQYTPHLPGVAERRIARVRAMLGASREYGGCDARTNVTAG